SAVAALVALEKAESNWGEFIDDSGGDAGFTAAVEEVISTPTASTLRKLADFTAEREARRLLARLTNQGSINFRERSAEALRQILTEPVRAEKERLIQELEASKAHDLAESQKYRTKL